MLQNSYAGRYAVALVAVALALLLRGSLDPFLLERSPIAIFYLSTLAAAWYGGVGPGLMAAFLGIATAQWLFVLPADSLYSGDTTAFYAVLVHATVSSLIVVVIASARMLQRRAAEALVEGQRHETELLQQIAERRRVELALIEAEARARGVIEAASDGIITIDDQQHITLFSAGAERMFGYCAGEVLGKPLDLLLPPRFRDIHRQHLQAFAATGQSRVRAMGQRVLMALRADGTEFPIEAQIARVNATSTPSSMVVVRDVTETERLQAQRQKLFEQEQAARVAAEAANRAKDEFVATVSHELRTPLSPILAWVPLLRDGPLDTAQAQRAVDAIERNARALAALVDDLVDGSRIAAGTLRLEIGAVDLVQVVLSSAEAIRSAAEGKNIRVEVSADPGVGSMLGDARRLQQVCWHMLSNAVKFTPSGGQVSITLRRLSTHAEIVVADSGPGIEETFLPRVFERFLQGDGSSTRAQGGLGLGLSIVRHLVELHGGTVRAANRAGTTGALLTVVLPLRPLVGVTAPAEDTPGDVDPHVKLEGMRVLMVDDDHDSLDAYCTLLERSGAKVQSASSADAALEILRHWTPDVLVSDVGMPGRDGYSLIAAVRGLPGNLAQLPAIAFTAYTTADDRRRLMAAGFNLYLAKPAAPHELMAQLTALRGRRV